jgi:hypothetical protein
MTNTLGPAQRGEEWLKRHRPHNLGHVDPRCARHGGVGPFIRSYATLTRVTDESDVVLSYVGTTKAV